MNNVIQFPSKRSPADIEKAKARSASISDEIFYLAELTFDDCVNMSNIVAVEMNEIINNSELMPDFKYDFLKSKESQEYKDMSVIVNLLTSALLRSKGLSHLFQEDLDSMYTKIQYIESEMEPEDDST